MFLTLAIYVLLGIPSVMLFVGIAMGIWQVTFRKAEHELMYDPALGYSVRLAKPDDKVSSGSGDEADLKRSR